MPQTAPLTPDQRVSLVLSLLRKEDTLEALARKHQVSPASVARWRDDFIAGGKASLGSGKVVQNQLARRVDELSEALNGRDQVIGELLVANRILKKTGGLG